MNANLMMLLPLLLAKNGGSGGVSPEMMMKMFAGAGGGNGGGSGGGINPMAAMLMSLMGGNRGNAKPKENVEENVKKERNSPSDMSEVFGKDVMNMLRIFMEMNARKGQSGSV